MHLFSDGIQVSQVEYQCLLYMESDPNAWLASLLHNKAYRRRTALIELWRPRFLADPSITELPADAKSFVAAILAHPDYKTRTQQDAEVLLEDKEVIAQHIAPDLVDSVQAKLDAQASVYSNIDKFNARPTIPEHEGVVLWPLGLDLADEDCDCLSAFICNLDDWVYGALMGQINRGKKKMLAQYHPIMLADPSVTTMPATEDGLIEMIVARDDYQTRNN